MALIMSSLLVAWRKFQAFDVARADLSIEKEGSS